VYGNYSALGFVHTMVFALQKKDILACLNLLKQSFKAEASGTKTATFFLLFLDW